MSMDLQFEHATDDSKPNRKVIHSIYAKEDPAAATRQRVCRPTSMSNEQCQSVINLVEARAKVTKRILWKDLYENDIHQTFPQKRHKRALVLGSGPSVNLLTASAYERLRRHVDVWSINNAWVNRWVQPDFWHMEFYTMNADAIEAPGGLLDFQKRWVALPPPSLSMCPLLTD